MVILPLCSKFYFLNIEEGGYRLFTFLSSLRFTLARISYSLRPVYMHFTSNWRLAWKMQYIICVWCHFLFCYLFLCSYYLCGRLSVGQGKRAVCAETFLRIAVLWIQSQNTVAQVTFWTALVIPSKPIKSPGKLYPRTLTCIKESAWKYCLSLRDVS